MCAFRKLIEAEYDQGPLAFIKVLLLLRNVLKVLHVGTLELHTIYRNTQVHTNKKYNKKETIHQTI
jgi:hypothetical protein